MKNLYQYSFILLLFLSPVKAQDGIDGVFVTSIDQMCFSLEYQQCVESTYSECVAELSSSIESCRSEIALPANDDLNTVEVAEYVVDVSNCAVIKHLYRAIERTGNDALCE